MGLGGALGTRIVQSTARGRSSEHCGAAVWDWDYQSPSQVTEFVFAEQLSNYRTLVQALLC